MNNWYDLTNGLDTDVQPLDDLTQARVVKRVKNALPRRRKKRLLAVVAAVLVLSACGYAVATGQFSDWFWNYSQDPQAPENSEDLLAGLGTVISQSQTADDTTITLDGALWDGNTLVLSLSITGADGPSGYWTSVKTENSWLHPSRENLAQTMRKQFPDMAEDVFQESLEQYLDTCRHFSDLMVIDYIYNRRTEAYQMQIKLPQLISFNQTETEWDLHLENLEVSSGKAIPGPFDFTFTVEKRDMSRVYTGDVTIQTPGGYACRVTKVTVSPLGAEAEFEMLESVPEEVRLFDELCLETLLGADGREVGAASQHDAHLLTDENGRVYGTVKCGPFRRVVDPAAVEAVQIGGTWVVFSKMTLEESRNANTWR